MTSMFCRLTGIFQWILFVKSVNRLKTTVEFLISNLLDNSHQVIQAEGDKMKPRPVQNKVIGVVHKLRLQDYSYLSNKRVGYNKRVG